MDITIVIGQMCVMLILILIGYICFNKDKLSAHSSSHISALVVNICNPAALICSALEKQSVMSVSDMLSALFVTICLYAVLLFAGLLIPRIMRIPKDRQYLYHFLTVYGNVGFLGIPLVSAVLGSGALVYVSISCVIYNLLFYTTGVSIIRKKAGEKAQSGMKDFLSKIINAGTVSALLTALLYLVEIDLPMVVSDTITYAGRATTFLSMIVLGVSVAQLSLKDIFCHKKDYLFVLLRMVLLPVCCVFLMKPFVTEPLLLGTSALLLSVPCGNLPLMCSREHGLQADELARIIVLTTLLSVVTIPLVVLFI